MFVLFGSIRGAERSAERPRGVVGRGYRGPGGAVSGRPVEARLASDLGDRAVRGERCLGREHTVPYSFGITVPGLCRGLPQRSQITGEEVS